RFRQSVLLESSPDPLGPAYTNGSYYGASSGAVRSASSCAGEAQTTRDDVLRDLAQRAIVGKRGGPQAHESLVQRDLELGGDHACRLVYLGPMRRLVRKQHMQLLGGGPGLQAENGL